MVGEAILGWWKRKGFGVFGVEPRTQANDAIREQASILYFLLGLASLTVLSTDAG